MTRINAPHMTATLRQQTEEAVRLNAASAANLKELGYYWSSVLSFPRKRESRV